MSVPRMEQTPGLYRFYWDEYGLCVSVSRIHDARDGGTTAELLMQSTAPGVPSHLHQGRLNLTSTTMRHQLCRYLGEQYPGPTWTTVMEQLCYHVLNGIRRGEPVVKLTTIEAMPPPRFVLYPLLPERVPTIIFGLGGTGKSLLALLCGVTVQLPWTDNPLGLRTLDEATNVLYLDWETDGAEVQWRLRCLEAGLGLFALEMNYRRCALPLADDIESIREMVMDTQAALLIVDSAAAACGGDINNAEPVIRFFTALRQLGQTTLVLAHAAKNTAEDRKHRTPFGSAFFENFARSTWECMKVQEAGEDVIEVGLFHRKANFGRLQKPVGFEIGFQAEATTVRRKEVARISELAGKLSMPARLREILKSGKKNVKELAELTGENASSLRVALNRMAEKGEAGRFGDDWGLLA